MLPSGRSIVEGGRTGTAGTRVGRKETETWVKPYREIYVPRGVIDKIFLYVGGLLTATAAEEELRVRRQFRSITSPRPPAPPGCFRFSELQQQTSPLRGSGLR
jgi:hypothetical protein